VGACSRGAAKVRLNGQQPSFVRCFASALIIPGISKQNGLFFGISSMPDM